MTNRFFAGAQVQADVLARMAELIEEEREYADKGNYGHLHNIDGTAKAKPGSGVNQFAPSYIWRIR